MTTKKTTGVAVAAILAALIAWFSSGGPEIPVIPVPPGTGTPHRKLEIRPIVDIEKLTISPKETNLWASAIESLGTRDIKATTYPELPAPEWYVGMGEYLASSPIEQITPYLVAGKRPVLLFRRLGMDWEAEFAGVLDLIPQSVCVLDYEPTEFNAPAIKDFAEKSGATELVFAWHRANPTMYTADATLVGMAQDVEGAVASAKEGNPSVFVWVCAVGGRPVSDLWAAKIKDIPFDGVALWQLPVLPRDWDEGIIKRAFQWADSSFDGRPVAWVGLYGAKVWKITDEDLAREVKAFVSVAVPKATEVARKQGYAAVWQASGLMPDKVYPGSLLWSE